MNTMQPEALVSQLKWRYATKKFDASRKIPLATWSALEQAFVLAPSSFGLQPWKFVVITDPAVKAKLPAISWNQTQPADCSHFVVFAGRRGFGPADIEKFIARSAQVRGVPVESLAGYKDMMLGSVGRLPPEHANAWCDRQAYIALGFLMAAAAAVGVDACPMEGIVGPEYDKLLGLDKLGYAALVGCAVGYRAADDKYAGAPKIRYSTEEVIVRV